MKRLIAVLAIIFLAGQSSGAVQHEIYSDNNKALVNTTIQLDCKTRPGPCPVNRWNLDWSKPENSEILSIRDSYGSIDDYTVQENKVEMTTNRGPSRTNETVEIKMLIDSEAKEIHAGLHKRTFSLPGFSDSRMKGFIRAPDLVSGRASFGFETGFSGEKMTFRGRGPVNLRIKTGRGYETRYFSFFGEKNEGTEIAYEVPVGTLEVVQDFELFPVAVMNDSTYDRKVNEWSAGEYFSGAIQIRSRQSIKEEFLPVLAHEVVHGLNDRILSWDQTRSSYFDEGVSKYVEYLVKRKLYSEGEIDRPPRELFGEEVKYYPNETSRSYYVLGPSGDKERLWEYYQNDGDFMKTWNALESSKQNRGFGYAYSELIIRKHIVEGGNLKDLYNNIDMDRKIEDSQEKWDIYSDHLDMTPCKYESRERFESCLKEVNKFDYPVYSASPSRGSSKLDIERLEVPNRTSKRSRRPPAILEGDTSSREFLKQFIDYISKVLKDLIKAA